LQLVTSIHGAEVFPDGKSQSRYSQALRLLLSWSDSIVAPSKRFKQDFSSVFPEFNAKTIVIHNGINVAEFDAPCSKRANEPRAPYILCVSAYKEQKAIDVLIRAFKRVLEEYPLLRLVLVGAGPLRDSLESLAACLGIRNRIDFLSLQSRSEVASLLRSCEVFVLPSRFETFGIVILEAMACKKPVVATTAGGIPEIIENEKNGILVPPDDAKALASALITILSDKNLRVTVAKNGHSTVCEQFCNETNGVAYESIFASLKRQNLQKAA
jgi:glycosyltransferase involved in cell wall biosynthesis